MGVGRRSKSVLAKSRAAEYKGNQLDESGPSVGRIRENPVAGRNVGIAEIRYAICIEKVTRFAYVGKTCTVHKYALARLCTRQVELPGFRLARTTRTVTSPPNLELRPIYRPVVITHVSVYNLLRITNSGHFLSRPELRAFPTDTFANNHQLPSRGWARNLPKRARATISNQFVTFYTCVCVCELSAALDTRK